MEVRDKITYMSIFPVGAKVCVPEVHSQRRTSTVSSWKKKTKFIDSSVLHQRERRLRLMPENVLSRPLFFFFFF